MVRRGGFGRNTLASQLAHGMLLWSSEPKQGTWHLAAELQAVRLGLVPVELAGRLQVIALGAHLRRGNLFARMWCGRATAAPVRPTGLA